MILGEGTMIEVEETTRQGDVIHSGRVKKVIVIRVPHEGDIVIDISTPEKHESVALSIVKSRMENGFYIEPITTPDPGFTKTQAKKFPAGEVRNFALQLLKQHEARLISNQHESEFYELVKSCIADQDGQKAIEILNQRKNYNDEGFIIHKVFPSDSV